MTKHYDFFDTNAVEEPIEAAGEPKFDLEKHLSTAYRQPEDGVIDGVLNGSFAGFADDLPSLPQADEMPAEPMNSKPVEAVGGMAQPPMNQAQTQPSAKPSKDGKHEEPLTPKPSMDWLDEEPLSPGDSGERQQQAEPQTTAPEESLFEEPKPRRNLLLVAAFALMLLGIGVLLAFNHQGAPKSVALEAERGAEQPSNPPQVEIGEAAPLTPPNNIEIPRELPAPEPPKSAPATRIETPASTIQGNPEGNPEYLPAVAPALDKPNPPGVDAKANAGQGRLEILNPNRSGTAANLAKSPPDEGAIAEVKQRLDMLQALIERLERSEKVLGSRLNGLELVNTQNSVSPVNSADAGTGEEASPEPKPKKVKRKPALPLSVVPQQRRLKTSNTPLPFFVETVDTWNGQKTIVIRQDGRLIDVHPGESHAGWRIDSADGQAVTLSDPDGASRTVVAGEGGRP